MSPQDDSCLACPICEDTRPKDRFILTERMFGFGGEFPYFLCHGCGLLWLTEMPEDMSKYYPSHYMSLAEPWPTPTYDVNLKWKILQIRDRYEWTGQGWLGQIMAKRRPNPKPHIVWPLRIKAKDRILDVGCGRGQLITNLHSVGLTTHGIDPFIDRDYGSEEEGFWIRKGYLSDLKEPYDVIMLHHSLEHMPDQKQVFKDCRRLLRPGGRVMIRIPTVSCDAWERYGEYWYELDAPRHLYLHSRTSIVKLANEFGFRLESLTDDAGPDQFSMSELYKLGIPLNSLDEATREAKKRALSEMPLERFQAETDEANRLGRGGRIAVVLSI